MSHNEEQRDHFEYWDYCEFCDRKDCDNCKYYPDHQEYGKEHPEEEDFDEDAYYSSTRIFDEISGEFIDIGNDWMDDEIEPLSFVNVTDSKRETENDYDSADYES